MITLITGGIKSGKSSHALEIAQSFQKCALVATADPDDESMKNKIAIHRKERESLPIHLIEEKINISQQLDRAASVYDGVILDCITVWLGNLMFMYPEKSVREKFLSGLIATLSSLNNHCVIITNEVGMGVIPENKLARDYGEELGLLNKRIARIANSVICMVSGIPLVIKS